MPTECERSVNAAIPTPTQMPQPTTANENSETLNQNSTATTNITTETTTTPTEFNSDTLKDTNTINKMDFNGEMSTSQTSNASSTTSATTENGHNGSVSNVGGRKTSITSPDPTAYVAKARVTRPTPPPPSYNPMQFVQMKPCSLYQTAQEQLKKAEEVKKIKEVKKEEPEDWQNNLDNWKSSRRKRVEHIIDRVVEVKKLELEEHDRSRRKSKTFSEMIEERGERGGSRGLNKLASLTVYTEDEANDFSDLGIGNSSASGKSSLSEDYDNNSVMSDNVELEKAIRDNGNHKVNSTTREYISSPGYDTSSSTAPASSPDPCEYTYEGAIRDYKQRVSRAASGTTQLLAGTALSSGNTYKLPLGNGLAKTSTSKESTPERQNNNNNSITKNGSASNGDSTAYPVRRGSKIEDRLIGFEVTSPSDSQEGAEKQKVDVPKIDISKRKEIFESQNANGNANEPKSTNSSGGAPVPRVTLRDRFKLDATATTTNANDSQVAVKKEVKRLSGDITSIRDRLQSLEQSATTQTNGTKLVDIPVPPLKDRLSSLQNAVTKEEVKKPPVALVDARQLEIMKSEEQKHIKQLSEDLPSPIVAPVESTATTTTTKLNSSDGTDIDRNDSGIHTSDDIDVDDRLATERLQQEQEQQLNAAIAALAMEERQLEEAANAVNQIEAEFAELSSSASVALPPLISSSSSSGNSKTTINSSSSNIEPQPCDMEFSVSPTNHSLPSPSSSDLSSTTTNTRSESISDAGNGNAKHLDQAKNVKEVLGSTTATTSNTTNTATTITTTTPIPTSNPNPTSNQNDVTVSAAPSSVNLMRKPSNEMVHARNLLKMFKDTFKSDIELDEEDEWNTSDSEKPLQITTTSPVPTSPFEREFARSLIGTPLVSPASKEISIPNTSTSTTNTVTVEPLKAPGTPSMIPRSLHPTGKPPMSPKTAVRSNTRPLPQSPVTSPTAGRKTADSQFSINGRVEIFNSKNMSNENAARPLTPTLPPPKKTLMTHFTPTASGSGDSGGSSIELPQHNAAIADTATATATATATKTSPSAVDVAHKTVPPPPPLRQSNELSANVIQSANVASNAAAAITATTTTTGTGTAPIEHSEIVICAPPMTVLNPDELPKPNTVKALSNCFSHVVDGSGNQTPARLPPPKPLPRSRIPQTPPQSPTPAKRNFTAAVTTAVTASPTPPLPAERTSASASALRNAPEMRVTVGNDAEIAKTNKLSVISNASTTSNDSMAVNVPFQTTAIVHSPPIKPAAKPLPPLTICHTKSPLASPRSPNPNVERDPLTPNASLATVITEPSQMPPLLLCAPNESSLFKLASSAPVSPATPASPASPTSSTGRPSDADVALCASFLNSVPMPPQPKSPVVVHNQKSIDESPCKKVDVRSLPPFEQPPCTYYSNITPATIQRCDNLGSTPTTPVTPTTPTTPLRASGIPKPNSKPNSPIVAARAAHSKALIETCERIIAEERLASNQIKSSLPNTPKATPTMQRKSKIPKPIQCCISSGAASKTEVDAGTNTDTCKPTDDVLLARTHVVETQIKVTTTTPPTSPKPNGKTQTANSNSTNNTKKTKNIFDFLRKNFGHHDDEAATEVVAAPSATTTTTATPASGETTVADTMKTDEIFTVENSKFYIPSDEVSSIAAATPPPLPLTPAPVNIEITRKITTDEILDESNSERMFCQEINDMLDEEMAKLSLDSYSCSERK